MLLTILRCVLCRISRIQLRNRTRAVVRITEAASAAGPLIECIGTWTNNAHAIPKLNSLRTSLIRATAAADLTAFPNAEAQFLAVNERIRQKVPPNSLMAK